MAFEKGVADGHADLLEKTAAFAGGNASLKAAQQNWTVLSADEDAPGYFFRAPGLSAKEEIYINIDCVGDSKNDFYNWRVYGAHGYDSAQPIKTQPRTVGHVMTLWNKKIPYWIVCNGQRLIVIAKVSTIYTFCYLGKIFPYATPKQYPYPVLIAGDQKAESIRWSDRSSYHRTLQSPGESSASIYLPDGIQQSIVNNYGDYDYKSAFGDRYGLLMPTHQNCLGKKIIQQNGDGSYTLLPYLVISAKDGGNLLGELDGVYWVTGHNNASENIITIGGIDHIVVQNIYRTKWTDYCAIKLH